MQSSKYHENKLAYVLYFEDGAYIARCLNVEVVSEGDSWNEAINNLRQALELYFEGNEASLAELPALSYQLGEISGIRIIG